MIWDNIVDLGERFKMEQINRKIVTRDPETGPGQKELLQPGERELLQLLMPASRTVQAAAPGRQQNRWRAPASVRPPASPGGARACRRR